MKEPTVRMSGPEGGHTGGGSGGGGRGGGGGWVGRELLRGVGGRGIHWLLLGFFYRGTGLVAKSITMVVLVNVHPGRPCPSSHTLGCRGCFDQRTPGDSCGWVGGLQTVRSGHRRTSPGAGPGGRPQRPLTVSTGGMTADSYLKGASVTPSFLPRSHLLPRGWKNVIQSGSYKCLPTGGARAGQFPLLGG